MNNELLHSNPFPGLKTFHEEDAHLFFGREKQIDELLKRLRTSRFLAVLGDSGSGKSSLIKAGVIPSLHSGFMVDAGSSWDVVLMRPGCDPLENLSAELLASAPNPEQTPAEILKSITETTLRRSDKGLVEVIRQIRKQKNENFLLIVDQFEELFSFNQYEKDQKQSYSEATAFVNLLLSATQQKDVPIFVIITMRSDFLGKCSEFHGFPEAINQAQYLIPNMSREETRRAISGPLAVSQIDIAPRLQTRLLNDVNKTAYQLPALQFTLRRMTAYWQQQAQHGHTPLDISHYEAVGGVDEAVNSFAEELYKGLGDMKNLQIADTVFTMLTDQTQHVQDMRRPTPIPELAKICHATPEKVISVIQHFQKDGLELLLTYETRNSKGIETYVDISHESLVHLWRRLGALVEEEQQSVNLYTKLVRKAKAYQAGKADLLKDPELMLARTWYVGNRPNKAWAHRYDSSFESAITYLKASEENQEKEHHTENKRKTDQRRQKKRSIFIISIIAGALFLLLVFLGFRYYKLYQDYHDLDARHTQLTEAMDENTLSKNALYYAQRAKDQKQASKKHAYYRQALTYASKAFEGAPQNIELKKEYVEIAVYYTHFLLVEKEYRQAEHTLKEVLEVVPRNFKLESLELIAKAFYKPPKEVAAAFHKHMANSINPKAFYEAFFTQLKEVQIKIPETPALEQLKEEIARLDEEAPDKQP